MNQSKDFIAKVSGQQVVDLLQGSTEKDVCHWGGEAEGMITRWDWFSDGSAAPVPAALALASLRLVQATLTLYQ